MAQNTAFIVFSDHGDMLGERGLWFKMNFLEGSARVPMMIAAPGWQPRRVEQPVSTLDVCPTVAALAGLDLGELAPWTDGEDLTALAAGKAARPRSEERRVGQAWISTCRTRGAPDH